ncbi:CNH domain-containing protein [Rhizoctonia solani]|nr:CNH domain-containing protein [Rhizoctonia solani]
MSRPSPRSGSSRPPPAPRTPSSTTIRQTQRPKVQIPPPPPSDAQPAINPSSSTALKESLDQSTRMGNTTRPRYDSYAYGPTTSAYSMPTPEVYQVETRPRVGSSSHRSADPYNRPTPSDPHRSNGRLAPPLLNPSPISRSWSAEPSNSVLHAKMNPRTADAQLHRPSTQFENVSAAWGQPRSSYVPGEGANRRNARPWEGSAFTVGNHVDVSADDLDSGYGESTHGHGNTKQPVTPARRSDEAEKQQQLERVYSRWGVDSETSFDTASNAEQIGTGVLADQVSLAESGLDKLALFHTSASSEFDDWVYVVPEEARNILDKHEIQRQSNIYELVKSERNFVIGMQIFLYIFRDGLLHADPPVISQRDRLDLLVREVFFNAQEILSIHLHLRDKLYERQRDQHPIIQTVADIYLKWLLEHKEPYTRFQKHLPKALNYHKTELRQNEAYRKFFNDIPKIVADLRKVGMHESYSPRLEDSQKPSLDFLALKINKQEFDSFLHGFNTRFTRLELQLTTMAKHTIEDHPDVDGDDAPIPLIVSTLKQVLSIASYELQSLQKRVDFENFCKKLHFRRGEIIDLDWYDEHRQLFMDGPLARRQRRDVEWHGWSDLHVGLLDNYLVVTKEVSSGGREQLNVVSRPIPLDYLRIAKPLNGPPETRRQEGCIIRDKLLGDTVQMYPFTVYHVAEPGNRRYTFYAESDSKRRKWLSTIEEAKLIRDTYQNENKYFAISVLSGRRFTSRTTLVPSEIADRTDYLGPVNAVAPFAHDGEHYLIYSTNAGIYLGLRHQPKGIQKVMRFTDVNYMVALQSFGKVLVLANESLYAYPFQTLVRVWRRECDMSELGTCGERISRYRDGDVQFFRAGVCEGKMLIGYVTKSILHVYLHVLEAVEEPSRNPNAVSHGLFGRVRSSSKDSYSTLFPQYGQTLSLPRDATDLAMLNKRIVVMCQSQILIVDPRDPAMKAYPVPDFMVHPSQEYGSAEAIASLKDRCYRSQSLGMVLSRSRELMVVYAEFGCYVTKYGAPARQSAFVRWETPATSVAFRWPYALLFSPNFIEVRNVETGGLVQVIQEREIRLLYQGPPYDGPILAAMRGEDDDKGKTDSVVEILATAPIEVLQGQADGDALWREWDL